MDADEKPPVNLAANQWHRLKLHWVVNAPLIYNGILIIEIDGKKAFINPKAYWQERPRAGLIQGILWTQVPDNAQGQLGLRYLRLSHKMLRDIP